jgi:hypothetical protein
LDRRLSRRAFLGQSAGGFGSLALASLLGADDAGFSKRGRARSVILLWMGGGPSHLDTFDPKPDLESLRGKPVPASIAARVPKNVRLRLDNLYASPFAFRRCGESGLPVSDLFRETSRHADRLCVIRSMSHESVIHTPAEYLTLTGSFTGTRPSLGAWLTYGLGSESRNLPGYVVTVSGENFSGPSIWQAGFLPSRFQGTLVKATEGLPDARLPKGVTPTSRLDQLDFLRALNRRQLDRTGADSDLEARIESYELAHRMQTEGAEAFDLARETEETRRLYGIDRPESAEYGSNCLLARRLVERGVRFVQLVQAGWDAHGDLKGNHETQARKCDRPIAGLLSDLERRGLLDETLVVWAGEFGRTPTVEGDKNKPGRDHSPLGYSVWLAGAGVKGGQAIGATDEIGYTAVERPVHPNDLQATILRLVGADQHELFFMQNGRKEIVTFLGGRVIPEVFA